MKKRPATKNALTPKRKYTKRVKNVKLTGGGVEDGLLIIEKYEGPVIASGFRTTEQYSVMENLIKHMKVKDSFIIKAAWKNYPHRIRKELDLAINLRLMKVVGNDNVRRVVRMS